MINEGIVSSRRLFSKPFLELQGGRKGQRERKLQLQARFWFSPPGSSCCLGSLPDHPCWSFLRVEGETVTFALHLKKNTTN